MANSVTEKKKFTVFIFPLNFHLPHGCKTKYNLLPGRLHERGLSVLDFTCIGPADFAFISRFLEAQEAGKKGLVVKMREDYLLSYIVFVPLEGQSN